MEQEISMITPGQTQYLHGLYRALGWDEDTYRSMLNYNFGVNSTSDLKKYQAITWISVLQATVKAIDNTATEKQVWMARQLWLEIDYSEGKEGDKHLNAFIKKYYHKNRLEELTKQECIKFVKQVKTMIGQAKERAGKTTVLRRRSKCVKCGAWIMWVELKDGRRVAFDCKASPNPSEGGEEEGNAKYVATNFHEC